MQIIDLEQDPQEIVIRLNLRPTETIPVGTIRRSDVAARNDRSIFQGTITLDETPGCSIEQLLASMESKYVLSAATYNEAARSGWHTAQFLFCLIKNDAATVYFQQNRAAIYGELKLLCAGRTWLTKVYTNPFVIGGIPIPNTHSISVNCAYRSKAPDGADFALRLATTTSRELAIA